jgi:hypothetical protein
MAPKLIGKCFDRPEVAFGKVRFFQTEAAKAGRSKPRFTVVKLTIGKYGYGVIRPLGVEEGGNKVEGPRKKENIFL